jgi:hypothetical protein
MAGDEKRKAGKLVNERTPILQRKSTYATTLPTIEDIFVEVTEHGSGVFEMPFTRTYIKLNVCDHINCSDPNCYNGGFSLGNLIREMVDKKQTHLEKNEICQGYQGISPGKREFKKCLNFFEVRITIKYKEET